MQQALPTFRPMATASFAACAIQNGVFVAIGLARESRDIELVQIREKLSYSQSLSGFETD